MVHHMDEITVRKVFSAETYSENLHVVAPGWISMSDPAPYRDGHYVFIAVAKYPIYRCQDVARAFFFFFLFSSYCIRPLCGHGIMSPELEQGGGG
jgi:hypothetical protein